MKNAVFFCLMFAMFLPAAGCKDKPEPGTDPVEQPDWIVGADLSLLSRIQAAGGVYKDSQGKDVDALSFLRKKDSIMYDYGFLSTPTCSPQPVRICLMYRK